MAEPAVEHSALHEPEWDVSPWPLVLGVGIFFLVPISFSLHFVYQLSLYAALSLGIGAPLVVAGVAGWISEAIADKHGEGLSPGAMGWFIVAEAMIFITLFVTYWLMRLSAPSWPPAGSVELPTIAPLIMTVILVSSSFTIHAAELKLERGDRPGFLRWLLLTMVLGTIFVSISFYEWGALFREGFDFATNVYSTAFFSITGFHAAHVLVGLGIFLAILLPALRGNVNLAFLKTGSVYWHFVDIIWLFVVSQVYFW